jgi:hypothetical protein
MKKYIFTLLLLFGFLGTSYAAENGFKNDLGAYGTLSDANNPADVAASAVYTRLAMYRHIAAQKLKAKKITRQQAIDAQSSADAIRKQLDAALKAKDLQAIGNVSKKLEKQEKRR